MAVIIAAIVAPADERSIEMMRACLVAAFGEADAASGRDLDFLIFRAAGRVATLVFDLGLVMGSSEVGDAIRRTTSALPGK